MAREYAAVRCSIWGDEDWRDLSGDAQHLYFTLLTQGGLSFCGVADYYPKRLAALTRTFTIDSIEAAAAELEDRGYLVVDRDTDEALIRSFVRWDGLLRRPNVAVAMAKNYHGIVSLKLRRAFIRELLRLHEDESFRDCPAWGAPKVSALLGEPSTEPIPEPPPTPSAKGSGEDCLTTASASASTTASLNHSKQASSPALATVDDRPDVTRLCEHLAHRIVQNGSKAPEITGQWRTHARLLLDKDRRTEEEAHRLIDWCQADGFWMGNVLSMPTFRQKYDTLRLQAQRPATVPTTDRKVAAAQSLKGSFGPNQLAIGAS